MWIIWELKQNILKDSFCQIINMLAFRLNVFPEVLLLSDESETLEYSLF